MLLSNKSHGRNGSISNFTAHRCFLPTPETSDATRRASNTSCVASRFCRFLFWGVKFKAENNKNTQEFSMHFSLKTNMQLMEQKNPAITRWSHYLQGSIHPNGGWPWDFWTINSSTWKLGWLEDDDMFFWVSTYFHWLLLFQGVSFLFLLELGSLKMPSSSWWWLAYWRGVGGWGTELKSQIHCTFSCHHVIIIILKSQVRPPTPSSAWPKRRIVNWSSAGMIPCSGATWWLNHLDRDPLIKTKNQTKLDSHYNPQYPANKQVVGGLNPFEKYEQIKLGWSPPRIIKDWGENSKNVWNHHLVHLLFYSVSVVSMLHGKHMQIICLHFLLAQTSKNTLAVLLVLLSLVLGVVAPAKHQPKKKTFILEEGGVACSTAVGHGAGGASFAQGGDKKIASTAWRRGKDSWTNSMGK